MVLVLLERELGALQRLLHALQSLQQQVVARDHLGVRYRAFDLFEAGPDRIAQMLDELAAMFGEDVLRPLPGTRSHERLYAFAR